MTELRDSTYYKQLARKARQLAEGHANPVVARHLREQAIQHDRLSRKLARREARSKRPAISLKKLFSYLKP
tara:strand:+ start:333 stop:545 length:213 start_codon:yes stop_codon:yes gene_type:complete